MKKIASCEDIIARKADKLGELWRIAASDAENEVVRCAALERYAELASGSKRTGVSSALWLKLDRLRENCPESLHQVITEWQRELPRPRPEQAEAVTEESRGRAQRVRGAAVRTRGAVRTAGRAPQAPIRTRAGVSAEARKRAQPEVSQWFAGIKD